MILRIWYIDLAYDEIIDILGLNFTPTKKQDVV